MHAKFLAEKRTEEKLGRLRRVCVRVVLKEMLSDVLGCGLDSRGSGICPVAGCCEHGNKSSVSIKRQGIF
jgi:hypothetical protein